MRIRVGEAVALGGAILLAVALLRPWYQTPSGNVNAWDTFGPAVVLIIFALIAALAMVVAAVTERNSAVPVVSAVWNVPLGLAGLISAIVRMIERPEHATSLCVGAWLALAGAALVALAPWLILKDERPAAFPPASPELRPAP
ncbi:MAG TPA: hypothetical protein VH025_03970 [Solirubrobacteraceae bacterium]|jgi:hypothetical protein|nr:hypothetical protein [Solirubrobacteraceae bacterium]